MLVSVRPQDLLKKLYRARIGYVIYDAQPGGIVVGMMSSRDMTRHGRLPNAGVL
jgi:hypothetical protein